MSSDRCGLKRVNGADYKVATVRCKISTCNCVDFTPCTQTWLHALWPYTREQDGAFVQLQAVLPSMPAPPKAAGSKSSSKAGKANGNAKRGDAGKGDQSSAAPAATGSGGTAASTAAPAGLAKLWFVRVAEPCEGGGFKTRMAHELPENLSLLPSLLR